MDYSYLIHSKITSSFVTSSSLFPSKVAAASTVPEPKFSINGFSSQYLLLQEAIFLSNAIILCQEIGPVPIKELFLRFLFRMDIEFIEDHHLPVPCIINRPLMRLAVRGDVRGK